MNVTIPANRSISFLNNYFVDEDSTRPNDPITQTHKTDDGAEVVIYTNNTLTEDIIADYENITVTRCTLSHDGWLICTDNQVELPNWSFTGSTNQQDILTYEPAGCSSLISSFVSYTLLVGLIGTILLVGLVFAYLFGILDKSLVTKISIVGSITMLIVIGILIIVGIIIVSSVCALV